MDGGLNSLPRGKSQTVQEVVESLGLGWAQVLVLALGSAGVFLSEGIALVSFNMITVSAATDLHLSHTEQSMLTTFAFCGLFAGITCSGYFADAFGRRLPIVLSYATLALCLFLCSVLQSWTGIIIAGFGAGFGSGFGIPPSIAQLSEVTPLSWRMSMRAAAAFQYNMGMVYVCVLCITDDATLVKLDWRRLLLHAAIPVAALFVLAAAFLPESPVFLATKGYKEKAELGFLSFGNLNRRIIAGTYEIPEPEIAKESLSLLDQLKVIFSRQYRFATVACTYACFCLTLALYGGLYAQPQIFVTASALPPAVQSLISALPGAVAILFASTIAAHLSRKAIMTLTFLIGITTAIAVIIGGGALPPRFWLYEALFQYGTLFSGAGLAMGLTVVFQIAVDIFPPSSSATGGAIIIGLGRVGSIIAPSLFEFMRGKFGTWQSFYIFMDACYVAAVLMWCFLPSSNLDAFAQQDGHDAKQAFAGTGNAAGYLTMKSSQTKEV